MNTTSLRVAGIVLCGGRSIRMGMPKAMLPFGDETALQRVVRIVGSVVTPVIVVGSQEFPPPKLPANVQFIVDAEPFQGPLSGLITGLKALSGQADVVYLSGCDTPLLKPDFLRVILSSLPEESDIAAVDDGTVLQPLAAVYRLENQAGTSTPTCASVLEQAQRLLSHNEHSLQSLLHMCRTHRIPVSEIQKIDPGLDSLKGMNTPAEYESLLKQGLEETA